MKPFAKLRELLEKSTPGPWGPYSANIPFYAIVTKPAPSLSKHDGKQPMYWRVDDAQFIAEAHNQLPKLLGALDVAVEELENISDDSDIDVAVKEAIHALAKIKALGDE